jgi:hypothetical protein
MKKLPILVLLIFSLSFIFGCGTLAENGNDEFSCDGPPSSEYPDFSRAVFARGDLYIEDTKVIVTVALNPDGTGSLILSPSYFGAITGVWQLAETNPVKVNFDFVSSTGSAGHFPGFVIFYKNHEAHVAIVSNWPCQVMGTWYQE